MNKVQNKPIRVDDLLRTKVSLSLEYPDEFHRVTVEFRHDGGLSFILWTSEGSIYKNKIILTSKKPSLECVIEHVEQETDCIIALFDERGDLADHESLPLSVEDPEDEDQDIQVIKSTNAGFKYRLEHFIRKTSSQKQSTWTIVLEASNSNISGRIIRSGEKKIFVAFGQPSDNLAASDYIFPIDKDTGRFVIPKEIIWKNYESYVPNLKLACFEIVKADFHKIDNLFYKMQISNSISLSDLPKKRQQAQLHHFSTPTGLPFDADLWEMKESLPVDKE